jgi:hypothetical protein
VGKFALFVDGGYLDKVNEHEFGRAPIDLGKLPEAVRARLAIEATLLRAYYYHCPVYLGSPPTEEQRRRQAAQDRYFDPQGVGWWRSTRWTTVLLAVSPAVRL